MSCWIAIGLVTPTVCHQRHLVPVVLVAGEEHRPGGAANVALNVVSLGAKCTLISAVGEDSGAADLQSTLEAAGVVCDFVTVPDWPTVVKLRVLAQKQQLIRIDFEEPLPDDGFSERNAAILNKLEKASARSQCMHH